MRHTWLLIWIVVVFSCQPRTEKEITTEEIKDHIAFLASDELKGRYPGTPEDKLLSDYITRDFRHSGLTLLERKGVQPFGIVTDIEVGPEL